MTKTSVICWPEQHRDTVSFSGEILSLWSENVSTWRKRISLLPAAVRRSTFVVICYLSNGKRSSESICIVLNISWSLDCLKHVSWLFRFRCRVVVANIQRYSAAKLGNLIDSKLLYAGIAYFSHWVWSFEVVRRELTTQLTLSETTWRHQIYSAWAPARGGEQGGKRPPWKKSGWAWPTLEILAVVWKLPGNVCQWKYSGEQFMCMVVQCC